MRYLGRPLTKTGVSPLLEWTPVAGTNYLKLDRNICFCAVQLKKKYFKDCTPVVSTNYLKLDHKHLFLYRTLLKKGVKFRTLFAPK